MTMLGEVVQLLQRQRHIRGGKAKDGMKLDIFEVCTVVMYLMITLL